MFLNYFIAFICDKFSFNKNLSFMKTISLTLVLILISAKSISQIHTSPYSGKAFHQNGSDVSSKYIRHDQIGLPLKGYVVSSTGVVKEAVIVYQEPEKLMSSGFDLAICHEANGKKADVLNPHNEPNFASWLNKKELRAFYVGDQLFVQATPGKWYILMEEGTLSKLVSVLKTTNNGVTGYQVFEHLQKLTNEPVGLTGMVLNFKNSMSSLVSEHNVLAAKIKNKEKGYTWMNLDQIIIEFNTWYATQGILTQKQMIFQSNVETASNETKPLDASQVSASSQTNAVDPFQNLEPYMESIRDIVGKWTLESAIINGKDYKNQILNDPTYLSYFFSEMVLNKDGVATFDKDFTTRRQVGSSSWILYGEVIDEQHFYKIEISCINKETGESHNALFGDVQMQYNDLIIQFMEYTLKFVR
jgi:hypothetical protein